ncbi:MAG: class I SAM-dependent RNA methyltransferase [Beijerinckiaceae bacterium]
MSTDPADLNTVIIDHLGSSGDGMAITAEGFRAIPFAVPGDAIIVDDAGRIAEIITPSPNRREPFCPEFGRCGGCAMQHVGIELYAAWKHALVQRAVNRAGFTTDVKPVIIAHGEGRRRAIIHVRFGEGGARAGFMAARSHDLMTLETCPILVPELKDAFRIALAATAPLAGRNKPLDVQITSTSNGLDVDIRGHGAPDARERLRLIAAAADLDLARLSIHREIIVERRPPMVQFGDIPVILPPRAFLQATAEADRILGDLVLAALGKAKAVADLFCGAGPFALRLAAHAKVYAADEGKEAIAALERAARSRQGLKPVTAEVRDLFRRPLLPKELAAFDCVVIDPPRAGAEAQMRQIVASRLGKVISVSCDLQSFIRDAEILAAGGFRLESVTPVDQFAWSKHIELVGIFRR